MSLGIFYEHLRAAARQEGIPLGDVCKRAAAMGYEYVDIEGAEYLRDRSEVDALLGAAGMCVGCVDGRFDLAHGREAQEAEALLRFAAQQGVPHALLIPGYVNAGENRAAVMARVAEGLRPLAALGASLGVACSLEDYDAAEAPYGTSGELAYYLDRVEGLGCTFDTGNFAYFGEDALAALGALKPRVAALHLKDRAPASLRGESPTLAADGVTPLYPCAVGEGSMPVREIVRAFAGTQTMMTVEHFGANRQLEVMRRSAEAVRRWLEE